MAFTLSTIRTYKPRRGSSGLVRRRRIKAVRVRRVRKPKPPPRPRLYWTPRRIESFARRAAIREALRRQRPVRIRRSARMNKLLDKLADLVERRSGPRKRSRKIRGVRFLDALLGIPFDRILRRRRRKIKRRRRARGRRPGSRINIEFRYGPLQRDRYPKDYHRKGRASRLKFWQVAFASPYKWRFRSRKNPIGYWEVTKTDGSGVSNYGTPVFVTDFPPSRITPVAGRTGNYYLSFTRRWISYVGGVFRSTSTLPPQIGIRPDGQPMYEPLIAYEAYGTEVGGTISTVTFYYSKPPFGWRLNTFVYRNQIQFFYGRNAFTFPDGSYALYTNLYTQEDVYFLGVGNGGYQPHPSPPSDALPYLPAPPGQPRCTPGGKDGGTGVPLIGSPTFRYAYTIKAINEPPWNVPYPGIIFGNSFDGSSSGFAANGWQYSIEYYDYDYDAEVYGTVIYYLSKAHTITQAAPLPTLNAFPYEIPNPDEPYTLWAVGNIINYNGLRDPYPANPSGALYWDPPVCLPAPPPPGAPTWTCTCPDFSKREDKYLHSPYPSRLFDREWLTSAAGTPLDCKHIKAVKKELLPWAALFRKLWKKGVREYNKRQLRAARKKLREEARREGWDLRSQRRRRRIDGYLMGIPPRQAKPKTALTEDQRERRRRIRDRPRSDFRYDPDTGRVTLLSNGRTLQSRRQRQFYDEYGGSIQARRQLRNLAGQSPNIPSSPVQPSRYATQRQTAQRLRRFLRSLGFPL